MLTTRSVVAKVSVAMIVLSAGIVYGQGFPNKPIRIVTNLAGGGADAISRLIAQGISGPLGQPVIVENRSSGFIPGEIVSKAPPDGYTLLFSGSALWTAQYLQENVPYDAVKDFSPISLTNTSPNILVVYPALPVKSVKELIALAKARPGELNYAASGIGTAPHIAAELFNSMAGVNITRINYKGGTQGVNDLISGQVQLFFSTPGNLTPHIKAGRLRVLAVTSIKPSVQFPGMPTIAETVPGYESVSTQGMFGPAKMPEAIIERLNQEIVRTLNRSEVKERLLVIGVEAAGSSPAQFAAAIRTDMARLAKVIKDAGIQVK